MVLTVVIEATRPTRVETRHVQHISFLELKLLLTLLDQIMFSLSHTILSQELGCLNTQLNGVELIQSQQIRLSKVTHLDRLVGLMLDVDLVTPSTMR